MVGRLASWKGFVLAAALAAALLTIAMSFGQSEGSGARASAAQSAPAEPAASAVPLAIAVPAVAPSSGAIEAPVRVVVPAAGHARHVPAKEYLGRLEQAHLFAQKHQIDAMLADRYWNPESRALDDAQRETLKGLMREDVLAIAAAKRVYADGIDKESDKAIADGRVEATWSKGGKAPPLPAGTPENTPVVVLTNGDTSVRVVMDSAHFPQLDAAKSAFDAQRAKLHDDLLSFIATNGISKAK